MSTHSHQVNSSASAALRDLLASAGAYFVAKSLISKQDTRNRRINVMRGINLGVKVCVTNHTNSSIFPGFLDRIIEN